MVVTNWPTVSATSAIAVATNIHGKTSARLYDSAVLGKVLNGVSTVDALLSLAIARDHVGVADGAIDTNVLTLAVDESVMGSRLVAVAEHRSSSGVAGDSGLLRTSKTSALVTNSG
jgi:hypothetical protein